MAFNNSINFAAVFNRILDEKFYILPRTMWMENTDPSIVWTGGKEIKIPKPKSLQKKREKSSLT